LNGAEDGGDTMVLKGFAGLAVAVGGAGLDGVVGGVAGQEDAATASARSAPRLVPAVLALALPTLPSLILKEQVVTDNGDGVAIRIRERKRSFLDRLLLRLLVLLVEGAATIF